MIGCSSAKWLKKNFIDTDTPADQFADGALDTGHPVLDKLYIRAREFQFNADVAYGRRDLREAARLYREALNIYHDIRRRNPDWKKKRINGYIEIYTKELKRLSTMLPGGEPFYNPKDDMKNNVSAASKAGQMSENANPKVPADSRQIPVAAIDRQDDLINKRISEMARLKELEKVRLSAKKQIITGDLTNARSTLINGLYLDPDDVKVRILFGLLHCRAGEFKDAVLVMEQLIKDIKDEDNDTDKAYAHFYLGTASFGLGKLEDAERHMKEALVLDQSMAAPNYNLARIMLMRDSPDEKAAKKYYKRYMELGGKPDKKLNARLSMP
jgi:tetratricopeptide (TPR) repeat protein